MGILMPWTWVDSLARGLEGLSRGWMVGLEGLMLLALVLGLFVGLVSEMIFAQMDDTLRQFTEDHPDHLGDE